MFVILHVYLLDKRLFALALPIITNGYLSIGVSSFFTIYLLFLLPAWLFHCLSFIIPFYLFFSLSASWPVYQPIFSSLVLSIRLFSCWPFCLFLSLYKVFSHLITKKSKQTCWKWQVCQSRFVIQVLKFKM